MEAFGSLLLLLLVGLPVWIIWQKRFAVLRDSIADLYQCTAEVTKRLESVEQRLQVIAPAEQGAHVAAEQQISTVAAALEAAPMEERARVGVPELGLAPTPVTPEPVQMGPEVAAPLVPAAPSVAPPDTEWLPAEIVKRHIPQEPPPLPEAVATAQAEEAPMIPAKKPRWRDQSTGLAVDRLTSLARQFVGLAGWFARTGRGERIDWETLIGASWLNVIGIVVFIIGMALLAQHSLRQFGPVGKIATGATTSVVLLVCGVLLERKERYRLLAWTLIGGGWALLYFTAYAAHNIEASRVIADPATGLLLTGCVATGILIHSLKYRSQLLTGLAYGLGFFTVAMTPLNSYTLLASALLALSQIAVLRFLPWHYLALIAVAGTYLNHARWLGESFEQQPEFWLSQGILGFYWVLFVALAVMRAPKTRQEGLIHIALNLANTVGMLGLSAWQVWVLHGENLHYLTASATLAYAGASGVARVADRTDLFRLNSSVAVILFAITLPLALKPLDITNDWLAIYWTLGGIATIAGGYMSRELSLRREGYVLCAAAFVAVFAFNLQHALSLADWRSVGWWIVPSVILTFLALSEWLELSTERAGISEEESLFSQASGYTATAMLAVFLWKVSDPYLVGLCWLAAGLVFFEGGRWRSRSLSQNEGYILIVLAFVALVGVDLLGMYPASSGISSTSRWIIVGTSAAAYYYLSWRHREDRMVVTLTEQPLDDLFRSTSLFSIAGTVLLTILVWKELDPTLAGLAWLVLGLVLFEFGAPMWYALFALAFAALLAINLYEVYLPASALLGAGLLPRWGIVLISAAAYYYVSWRLQRSRLEPAFREALSIAGTVLLTSLVWKELDPTLAGLAWLVLGLALFEFGAPMWYALSALAFAALLAINLYGVYLPASALLGAGLLPRWAIVLMSAAVYYYLSWRHREDRTVVSPTDYPPEDLFRSTNLFSIAGTVLLTILVWKELDPTLAGLAWLILGLALFELGAPMWYALFALTFAALLTINLYEVYLPASALLGAGLLPRWAIVLMSAAAYYYVSWRLHRSRFAGRIEPGLTELLSVGGTVLLTVLAWKELDSVTVALAWALLSLALFEFGRAASLVHLRQQGHALALLTFGRLFMANFVVVGDVMGLSHRVLTVVPITALFYYLYSQTAGQPFTVGQQAWVSRLYSWAAAIALLALSRFELGRAYAVLGMAPLFVAFLIFGEYARDIDFRFQSYALAGLSFARCWATNAYLIGVAFGMPERVVTMLPVAAAFVLATAISMRNTRVKETDPSSVSILQFIDTNSHRYYSLLGAVLVAVLFYYELPIGWVTTALAIEGLILIVAGILSEERSFRIYGLVLLLASLLKLITIDFSSVEPIYRILSYIVVGLMLLAASLIYTRYRSVIERYI